MPDPFTIAIPDAEVANLRQRLESSRWLTDLPDAGWDYGTNAARLGDIIDHWLHRWDWREQEARLNALPQFRTRIDDADLHVVHVRSTNDDATPLLLLHGWPDGFIRFERLIPLLQDFHLVIPSLPGYGFSSWPNRRGVSPVEMADMLARAMREIGYERFIVHGGDIGSGVAQRIAQGHADALIGLHLTDVPYLNAVLMDIDQESLNEEEQAYMQAGQEWAQTESAYAQLQSTRPMTLAIALNDSPVGLASWIVEKFQRWGDPSLLHPGEELDRVLTNVAIYWFTQSIETSFLPYYEPMHTRLRDEYRRHVTVPTALCLFPDDLTSPPRAWGERFFDVVRFTRQERGSHFAALDAPDVLAADIRAFATDLATAP